MKYTIELCKDIIKDPAFDESLSKFKKYIQEEFFSYKPTKEEQEAVSAVHLFERLGIKSTDDEEEWEKINKLAKKGIKKRDDYYSDVFIISKKFFDEELQAESGDNTGFQVLTNLFLSEEDIQNEETHVKFLSRILSLIKMYKKADALIGKPGCAYIKTRTNEFCVSIYYNEKSKQEQTLEINIFATKALNEQWNKWFAEKYLSYEYNSKKDKVIVNAGDKKLESIRGFEIYPFIKKIKEEIL